MSTVDPALETLFLPFREGHLSRPESGALFLRARFGAALQAIDPSKLNCEQTFKPEADALSRAGFTVRAIDARSCSLVLMLPPRQRDESRSLMARAVKSLSAGGRVVACAPNNEGAHSHERDLEKLAGPVQSMSKHKCRVFWTAPTGNIDSKLLDEWSELDAPRQLSDPRFVSRPGLFAWDRVDPASQLLAQHLPSELVGVAADLGAGFGYLSLELLTRCPKISAVDLYEAESRALELAKLNLAKSSERASLRFEWHDVTGGLPRKYDVIVCNPPFHVQGSADRLDIGRRFIEVAVDALKRDGQLWLVANRHLPYEAALSLPTLSMRVVAQDRGFKVIAVRKVGESR